MHHDKEYTFSLALKLLIFPFKSIVVQEFAGIDELPASINELLVY